MAELSNEQWRDRLLDRFVVEFQTRAYMLRLYESVQPIVPILDRYSDAYKRILTQSRTPWGRLVVDIVSERMRLTGFTTDGDADANDDLWDTLRDNHIESVQQSVHRESLALGTSYVSVWPDNDGDPRVVQESGMNVVHEYVPGDPNTVAAALKIWHDSIDNRMYCNVYLPDEIVKYVSEDEVKDPQTWTVSGKLSNKVWVTEDSLDNPTDIVPLIPFVTRPNFMGYGRSDLAELEATIQRIETLTANTMLAVEFGAFRQRWATGLEIPVNEEGEAVEPFKIALDRLWVSEDPDTKFGSFDYTDIRPYLQAISDAIGQLSAVSRIPTLYFNQSDLSNPPSAASLEASETGLINKVKERIDRFSESWEAVAMLVLDVESPKGISSLWHDPRTRSDAQVVDAAVKMDTIGVPWEVLMAYIGYTPQEIEAMKTMRAEDTFNRLMQAALPTATALVPETPAQVEAPATGTTATTAAELNASQ